MKFIPILFSTPMVQAILEGRKTITRRGINWPDVPEWHDYDYEPNRVVKPKDGHWWPIYNHKGFNGKKHVDIEGTVKCPYGEIGDILWVKESFYAYGWWVKEGKTKTGKQKWRFVDFTDVDQDGKYRYFDSVPENVIEKRMEQVMGWHKRPSLFMPAAASRIFLKVKNERAEKLQDISEEDAKNEGIMEVTKDGKLMKYCVYDHEDYSSTPWQDMARTAKEAFSRLWQNINGSQSWEANDWTWVIGFERVEKPEGF